jgi:hypothetical protein
VKQLDDQCCSGAKQVSLLLHDLVTSMLADEKLTHVLAGS